ncbi:huntingtin-interacting protein K-like [Mercenaria mercenaria]|uniref:huntingtin-interacting protein K-like n=1 Tax=Mercenaria mercenaria TaxID=6596 RepID=UPI001E1DACAC|nr:huntingtin-interacting protein K-like [Mercenaria mercenaria]
MSAEDENPELNDEESSNKAKKSAKYDSGAADLEKVTDYVEEAEISPQNIGEAIRVANDENNAKNVAKKEKEKELSKVKISKEDVDLIVHEMEIPRTMAERKLREHKGNIVEALVALTN